VCRVKCCNLTRYFNIDFWLRVDIKSKQEQPSNQTQPSKPSSPASPATKRNPTSMAAVQTPAQQLEWLKSNAPDFDPAVKAAVEAFDETTPEFLIGAVFTQQHTQFEAALAARSEAEKLEARANELFEESLKVEVDVEGNQWGLKPSIRGKAHLNWQVPAKYIPYLIQQLDLLKESSLEKAKPKKSSKGKVSGTRERINKEDCIQYITNTKEDGVAHYKGRYACKADFEAGAVRIHTIKTYKVGEADPRPDHTGETLTQPLMRQVWESISRDKPIFDAEDANRCRGAVAWKQGRSSPWAKQQGFVGTAMAQCGGAAVSGGFCKTCKVDFFDKSNVYKGSQIAYVDGWGECVKC